MIIPDTNLLLYASDTASPFHEKAARWWQDLLNGDEPVGICAVVAFSFVRLSTSRRVFVKPMTIQEATGHVRSWLERSIVDFVGTEESDLLRALEWLEAAGSGANLTTDAQIAAIAARYRATVHTADTDFQRFAGVRWHNPILG
ncbi:MAG TPA: TA system VapC family ribonuclease toxin [Thermoanaerobaculia bacterium]|nr:TA system VapC family ribonuclease toxin [Thermoanaerobaculia bacterium]